MRPSAVIGIFTTIFGWIFAISRPSAIISSAFSVVAFTSPEIGPSTISVISLITSLKSRPSFAIRDGLVVTPQMIPMSFASLISSTLAVSIKNFMSASAFHSPFFSLLYVKQTAFFTVCLPQHFTIYFYLCNHYRLNCWKKINFPGHNRPPAHVFSDNVCPEGTGAPALPAD